MSDTLQLLGRILHGKHERDAVHIAVAPVVAGGQIYRSAYIGLNAEGRAIMVSQESSVGISDPFLIDMIEEGQQFFVYLTPGSITSLVHHWAHPKFPLVDQFLPRPSSVAWLENYAEEIGETFQDLMSAAETWLKDGEYWVGGPPGMEFGSNLESIQLPEAFWTHYQLATGKTVPESKQESFFTCVC